MIGAQGNTLRPIFCHLLISIFSQICNFAARSLGNGNLIHRRELLSLNDLEQNDYYNEDVATFGDRLEAARDAKGLTIKGMAEKIGVSVRTIKAWENDRSVPRGNRVQMLAGMLNVSMVWLISGTSNGTSNVAETHDRPYGVNDALGEISQLKSTLSDAVAKLEALEDRLLKVV